MLFIRQVLVFHLFLSSALCHAAETGTTNQVRTLEEFSELKWKGAAKGVGEKPKEGWCEVSSPEGAPLQSGLKLVLTNKEIVLLYVDGPKELGTGLLLDGNRAPEPFGGVPVSANLTLWAGPIAKAKSTSFSYKGNLSSIGASRTLSIETTLSDGVISRLPKSDFLQASAFDHKFLRTVALTAAPAAWEALLGCVRRHWG
jgi:hypothetical protein